MLWPVNGAAAAGDSPGMNKLSMILGTLTLLTLPRLAHAGEVECHDDYGSCSVGNEGQDWVGCGCADEGGTGGTGGNDWEDFSDEELMEICMAELAFCGGDDSDPEEETGEEAGCGGGSEEEGHHAIDDVYVVDDEQACSVAPGLGDAGLGLAGLVLLGACSRRRVRK